MAGGAAVFAYNPPSTIRNESNERALSADFFAIEEKPSPGRFVSDYFAVSDEGIVYDISYMLGNARVICDHNYSVPVAIIEHIRNSEGNCVINSYTGFLCEKCYGIKDKRLSNIATYTPCPHEY